MKITEVVVALKAGAAEKHLLISAEVQYLVDATPPSSPQECGCEKEATIAALLQCPAKALWLRAVSYSTEIQ